ncbi:hypothetical protein WMY93_028502 [Mugilogobius chulae]|uniref:Uncharacterized protein n=1 Tax=Mugilogobius chulae TaxID=88201 RepID=A0AAW0MV93_9GOBI
MWMWSSPVISQAAQRKPTSTAIRHAPGIESKATRAGEEGDTPLNGLQSSPLGLPIHVGCQGVQKHQQTLSFSSAEPDRVQILWSLVVSSCPVQPHLYGSCFITPGSLLPFCVSPSAGAGMAVAAACHASGLMGKNDRNLQLIMPRSEMFVSR